MDHNDPKKTEYSLEDILAEYGSGRHEPEKVVEMPEPVPEPEDESDPEPFPIHRRTEPEEEEPMAEIRPVSFLHGLAARVHTLRRRADHYADHMYDQAEPDEATLRAEKYIPGVDREEVPETPRKERKKRRMKVTYPDVPPAELARTYAKGLTSKKVRLVLAWVMALLCAAASVDVPALWDWGGDLTLGGMLLSDLRQPIILGLYLLAGGLCCEVLGHGLVRLGRLRPGADTLVSFAYLFTLADALALLLTEYRAGLPCCAVTALGLVFALKGDLDHRRGDRLSARTAAQAKSPYVVTLDEGKWSGRAAYAKRSGTSDGFGSQLQAEDGVQRAYRVAAPLLLAACLVCAGYTAVSRDDRFAFLWCASSMLTAAAAWPAFLVYAVPYRKLAGRLFRVGAAVAGWPGVARCREGGILMTDTDLFPVGAVQVKKIRVYGGVSNEKAIAYTASLLRVLGGGLARPFHDLLRSNGAFYREVSGVRHHEGGITGIIRNHEVYVGTADFMHLTDVALPQGMDVKHALFCAIDKQLAGVFALSYDMSQTVRPCLSTLMQEKVWPVLCTRDPNLIPDFLRQKFKLPVERMDFPPEERRRELSDPEQEHDETAVAFLSREGLGPYCDAVVGGIRLNKAARWGAALALLGGVIGAVLTFYLTFVGAVNSLTAVNFLLFMVLWLVPGWLLAGWVNQF